MTIVAAASFVALDYLIYTHEVIGNIVESHPVGGVVILLTALARWLLSAESIRAARSLPGSAEFAEP